jgi:hypothetical protein
MDDGKAFEEIRLNGKPLSACELALDYPHSGYRLYVDRYEDVTGFEAIAVEFVSCRDDNLKASKDFWDCPCVMANPLFNLIAYFDGVRHLEFNREAGDMAGYIYYPNMEGIIALMRRVREIEKEVCRECD